MADVTATFKVDVGRLGRRIRELSIGSSNAFAGPLGDEVIRAVRDSVAREFDRGGWLHPQGGFRLWPRGMEFGEREAADQPLGGGSGRIAQAWAGGDGGFAQKTAKRVVVGVRAPWARIHRGGQGNVNEFQVTRVRGSLAMWWYLGINFDVWVSQEKVMNVGFAIPARPHATTNPSLREELRRIVARYMTSKARRKR